jgi:hypothetical protein
VAQEDTQASKVFVRPKKKVSEMSDEELLDWSQQVIDQIRPAAPRPPETIVPPTS